MKPGKMFVDLKGGPDERDRFHVLANGRSTYLTVEQIKAAIARGDTLEEWDKQ